MKRIGYILMCVLSVLSVSCFDDDSNTDIRELNPIVIVRICMSIKWIPCGLSR